MAPHAGAAESRIFYGWWVAVAFSLIIFLSTGIRFAVGPFLKPVVGDLGIDRGTFSLVISLSLFLYGVFVPLVGPLVDRWGSRVVCSLGTVVMAVSLVLTAHDALRSGSSRSTTACSPRSASPRPGRWSRRPRSRAGS